ncbi:MAG: TonB-dependent receptor [Acidobacteria bacterium]|nr:TonB-dependent receptor [Acidobacteriota bacterium]MCI0722549.1 TonB-dependent receptor [Acidobacteriota bacterium]
MKIISFWILFLFFWNGFGSHCFGQTTQGEIRGTVSDESGAIIPGADVTVTSLEKGFKRTAVTNEQGFYSVPHLEPGVYMLEIALTGFMRFVQERVAVASRGQVRVDAKLTVGQVSDRMVVEAETPVIETDTGRISDGVDYRSLRDVVMNGRGVHNWFIQTAGALTGNGGTQINGSRGYSNGVTLDGASIERGYDGNAFQSLRPDQEMLREVRIDSVNNSAEFGHQATISQTSLNGSNEFHGQATYNHQNGALSARDFFAVRRPRGLPIHNWYVSVGGPVSAPGLYKGHNRTFFFFHHDGQERSSDGPLVFNTPTPAMRSGDFSAFPAIRDPFTGQPFPNNVIPSNRLTPAALKLMERFYALPEGPNRGTATPTSNFSASNPSGRIDRAWSLRIDQNLNPGHTLFVRYWQSIFDFRSTDDGLPSEVRQGPDFRVAATRSAIVSDTYSFTPKLLNEFRLGYLRFSEPRHGALKGKDVVDLAGLTGYPNPLDPDAFGLPQVTITGLRGITTTPQSRDTQNQWNVVNHVTWIHGSHSLKFGGDLKHNSDSQFPASPTLQFGAFNFDGFATGQPFADFLLGIPRTSSHSSFIGSFHGSNNEWSIFLQDDWNLTKSFNLNLGIRYERHMPWNAADNRIHSFDPATGSIVVPDADTIKKIHPLFPASIPIITASQARYPERSLVETDNNDVAPRIGFAWRTGLHGLVVRGGYGVFYNFEANKGFRSMTGGPFVAAETFDNRITNGQPLWNWPQAFPSLAARPLGIQDIFVTARDRISSYMHQWNLTAEKQIGEYGLRLSYIGSSGIQLPFTRNLNQPRPSTTPFNQALRPYPLFRNITYFDGGASQQYNSFQTELTKRFSDGFSLTAHYTWAKNLTNSNVTSIFGGSLENAHDRAAERGNEENTPPQRFMAYFIWDVAALSNRNPVMKGFLGGWRISGNVAANSGVFYTPFFTGRDISNTNVTTGRPDRISDGNLGSERTLAREFDLSAFVIPATGSGRFGNSGRGIIQGRGYWGMNLGLFKYFNLTEQLKFRLQAGIKNVFNHPKFGGRFGPQLNITAPTAGQTTRTDIITLNDVNASRDIEVGVRIEW